MVRHRVNNTIGRCEELVQPDPVRVLVGTDNPRAFGLVRPQLTQVPRQLLVLRREHGCREVI